MNPNRPLLAAPGSPDLPGLADPSRAGQTVEFVIRYWLRGWPAIFHLILNFILAGPYLVLAVLTLVGFMLLPVLLVGFPFLAVLLVIVVGLGHWERARIHALTRARIPARARPVQDGTLWKRVLLDPRPWWSLLYLTLIACWGVISGTIILTLMSVALAAAGVPLYASALPDGQLELPWDASIGGIWWLLLIFTIGVFGLLITPLLAQALVMVNVSLARWSLGGAGSEGEEVRRLSRRVQTLTRSREATVDSVEVERRRIERDLHDGPQQRLVAIAMDLGMAQQRLTHDPVGAGELLDKAHAAAKEAITEMRQVARGIHPPILTDRGLDAAISALAARCPVPVRVDVAPAQRPSPTVEAIAYFCVSEALTNVAKHARAKSAGVRAFRESGDPAEQPAGWLLIEIRDDGVGGADPARGTGLNGLTDRVQAIDGTLHVESPIGGPTVLTIRLPDTDRDTPRSTL